MYMCCCLVMIACILQVLVVAGLRDLVIEIMTVSASPSLSSLPLSLSLFSSPPPLSPSFSHSLTHTLSLITDEGSGESRGFSGRSGFGGSNGFGRDGESNTLIVSHTHTYCTYCNYL